MDLSRQFQRKVFGFNDSGLMETICVGRTSRSGLPSLVSFVPASPTRHLEELLLEAGIVMVTQ